MLDTEIGARRFVHNAIPYEFTFKEVPADCLGHAAVRRLRKYMALVEAGTFPNALFNDPAVPRASKMRVKNLEKGQKSFLQQYLLDAGLVTRLVPPGTRVPSLVQDVFDNFKDIAAGKVPAHEPVLKSMLLREQASVAIELPVWKIAKRKSQCLTGHVDLLQVAGDGAGGCEIRVMDYKPEGESKFIFCIPQVALYASMLREKLQPAGGCDIRCYIFDKKVVWSFSDDILVRIDGKLARYGVPRDWNVFIGRDAAPGVE